MLKMFRLSNLLAPKVANKTVLRGIRHKDRIKRNLQVDPGLKLTAKLLPEKELSKLDEIDFTDIEGDFNQLGMSYKEHASEINARKELEKYQIVKQKYFKEKSPNFLTWADKQQIQLLYNKDPDEWNIEKLSEGFPALPEIIKKIVKSNWSKKTTEKIRRHDESVQKNWLEFKKGKLNESLSPVLIKHLRNFTDRSLNLNPVDLPDENKEISLPKGEFSEIISSYEKLKSKHLLPDQSKPVKTRKFDERIKSKETYILNEQSNANFEKPMTLGQYRNKLTSKLDKDETDVMIINEVSEKKKVELEKVNFKVGDESKVVVYKKQKDYSHLIYPDQINIPKDIKKRGFTYKLNDCYYDDDGEFLYRVPGMK